MDGIPEQTVRRETRKGLILGEVRKNLGGRACACVCERLRVCAPACVGLRVCAPVCVWAYVCARLPLCA